MITLVLLMFRMFLQSSACTVIYKTTALPGCEKDFTPSTEPLNSSTVTYGTECLLLCRNNNKCNGISICPDPGNSGLLSCDLFATATDGTCGNLTSAAGCRYLEFEIVPNGARCFPPRIFDEERDECVCDPVWMTGPNCDQYYIDCTQAYTEGLTAPNNVLVIEVKPLISPAPFYVKCLLGYGGYTIFQNRHTSCPDNLTGLGWTDFRDGFGGFDCTFYLGLEKAYQILLNGIYLFNLKLYGEDGLNGNAYYKTFTLGNESTSYVAHWDTFGTRSEPILACEDGFGFGEPSKTVKGSRFATHDNDFNGCAQAQGTGWWFNENCSTVNLNLPLYPPEPSADFVAWPENGTLVKVERFTIYLKRTG